MRSAKARSLHELANKILVGTIIVELVLVGVYWFDILSGGHYQIVHVLFDLDGEANIPSWFSSAQLLFIALAFWTHALRQPARVHPSRLFFIAAGCAAVYVAMDETAQIHESVTGWLGKRYIDWLPRFTITHFWMIMLAVAIVITLIKLFARDLIAIWQGHRVLALTGLLGICIGLGGGMGLESLGYKLLHGVRTSLWYKVEVTFEEFMEMLGASLILYATLKLNGVRVAKKTHNGEALKVSRPALPSLINAPSR
jgi:hypothetical protein